MAHDRILFDSPLVRIGHFTCAPSRPEWSVENVISGTLVVFPSVPVMIHQAGREPVVADRNLVMYYNEGQPYRRGLLHERGDDAVWIAFKGDLAAAVLAEIRPAAMETPEAPFDRSHGPSPARSFLRLRALVRMLGYGDCTSAIGAEEAVVSLARGLFDADARARSERRMRSRPETDRSRRETTEQIKRLLTAEPGRGWTLADVVGALCISPAHLCRTFKQETGMSIHQYLLQLRLREAAAAVLEGERDLTALAIRLGYSTHSHFTEAFRRAFGVPPSRLRDAAQIRRLATARAG
ncbi:MAG TPA: AraC family transcriptional regulator [Phycisphaerales bacterium]|nr:AraC family transcriptional regulator [Phycisphaerales bacterium]